MRAIYFFSFVIALSFAFSCKNGSNSANGNDTIQKVKVDDFLASPDKWAGKEIVVSGTVSHVCRHDGKKLFIFGKDDNNTLKINAGGTSPVFKIELAGSEIEITGKVVEDDRIDEQYLKEWEEEIKKDVEDKSKKVCNAESTALKSQAKSDTSKSKESSEDPYKDVKDMRKKLKDSGKAYISVYAIDCISFKEMKQ